MSVSTEAMVRAAGRAMDDLGPPGFGRVYLVLEVPTADAKFIQSVLKSGRVGLTELPKETT